MASPLITLYLGVLDVPQAKRKLDKQMDKDQFLPMMVDLEGNILLNDALNILFSYMVSDIWQRTTQYREKTCCCQYIDYSF